MAADVQTETPRRLVRWWLRALSVGLALAAFSVSATNPRRGILLALTVVIGFLPFVYARRRLDRSVATGLARVSGRVSVAVWTGLGMVGDSFMVAQLLLARAPAPDPLLNASALSWIGPVWFSGHLFLLVGYGAAGLYRSGRRVLARRTPAEEVTTPGPALSRRGFLQRASVVAAGVPFGVSLSGVGTSYDFQVQHREVVLPNLPRAYDGLRLAHLSDIHVGGAMDRTKLLHVADLTNRAEPDIVLHTGDFLTHRTGNFDEPLYEALAAIRAPLGQWACLGNHDYDNAPRFVRRLAGAGVATLRDEVVTIDAYGKPLEIAGLEYVSSRVDRTPLYAHTFTNLGPASAPRIVLNHDPQAFSDLPDGCGDLVLSGHTHGGHVGMQLGPDHALSVVGLVGLRDQGVFERGDMRLFVTRCVGFYGYPMRIGIPPEIAILTLRSPSAVSEET